MNKKVPEITESSVEDLKSLLCHRCPDDLQGSEVLSLI